MGTDCNGDAGHGALISNSRGCFITRPSRLAVILM